MRSRLLVAGFIALSAAAASAQTTLSFVRNDDTARSGARSIVAVDVNRDGRVDLATANSGRNTVTVLRNGGTGFSVLRETAVGAGPFAMATGDLDRDGIPDLVVTTPDANAIDVLYGRADGTLRSRLTLTGTGASRGVTLADLTRDGRLDLVYTDYDRNRVVIRPGTSSGFGLSLPAIAVGTHPQDVVAADFNNDGYLDLAVANNDLAKLTVLYGRAGGAFTRTDVSAPAGLNVLAVADLNNDGWLDLAAASTSANKIVLYRDGPAGLAITTLSSGASPRGLAIADVNRDGRLDLLAANRSSSTVTLWLGTGTGTGSSVAFTKWGELPAGSGSRALVAADFDDDGRIDFATGNEYVATVTQYSNDTAFPRGAFAFQPQPLPWIGGYLAAADFNHNGLWDLVGQNAVLLDGVTPVNLPPVLSATQARAVTVGDLNQDGNADIVSSEAESYGGDGGHLQVLLGDGHGAFTPDGVYDGLSQARQLAIADMDRDGRPDIVVGGYHHAASIGVITILTPQAGGTFTVRQTTVAGWPTSLKVVDIDRDGKLDVVVSIEAPLEIEVLRGDGAGGLAAPLVITEPSVPYALALADVNLDGRLDIVTDDGPTVGVRLATGTLTWGPSVSYPVVLRRGVEGWPLPPTGVLAADVTSDGIPDVLIPSMAILPGRADGTLAPSEEFDAMGASLVVDWNHDGLLDVIADRGVLINRAVRPNVAPVARITTDIVDGTLGYDQQIPGFEASPQYLAAGTSTDGDLHALEFEWQDGNGKTLGWGPIYGIGAPDPLPPDTYTIWLIARDGRGGEGRTSFTLTITPTKEIVLWPGSWGDQMHPGAWQSVEDGTAANGRRLWYPNANAPKVETPLASPPAYFEYHFIADPTQTYKLWIRGKAQNNNPYNDSLWIQFSGSATVSGQPAYRIGTTSGLAVNIEECSGCGLSGWGWRDDGWGARNVMSSVRLRFPEGGAQTLYLQIREDGISVDHIMLSSGKYLATRPGPAKNDATIFQETQHYTAWD